jgi:drug/metabolite transporter (DMT)-like permease
MRVENNAIAPDRITGSLLGGLGVLGFSFSLVATKVAVAELHPWLATFGRATGAGLLSLAFLAVTRSPVPPRSMWPRLAIVALGVVVGFPLLTSLALVTANASHGAVVIALLPAVTAVFAVLRAGERPSPVFWASAAAGLLAVLVFVVVSGSASGSLSLSDLYLLGAVILCGLGYADGGALARQLGGPRTICWALVLTLPIMLPLTVVSVVISPPSGSARAWAGFGYITVVSMFLAFFAWYAGLARGGVAQVGQLQLVQPVLTLCWAFLLLHEHVGVGAVVAAVAVIGCVLLTQRARLLGAPSRARLGRGA